MFADVILPVPVEGLFTYSVPKELENRVCPFVRAKVPFGITKTHTALVVRLHEDRPADNIKVKDIVSVLDDTPVLLPQQYKLWAWISSYYMCPIGDILKAALPQGLKKEEGYRAKTEVYIKAADTTPHTVCNNISILSRSPKQQEVYRKYLELAGIPETEDCAAPASIKEVTREELLNASHATTAIARTLVKRGIMRIYDKEVGRLNSAGEPHPERIKPLSAAQQEAFNALSADNVSRQPDKQFSLLYGVTSSGKTEVYIRLIQEAIDRGEQVIYLLPEIALTVQITQRLQKVFGNRLGIYHSKYSDAERVEIWQRQLSDNPYDIILGARSAVFLPYRKLGLVIIDEEHETSFKQQDPAPRYHARSVALMMASWAGARVVLGTATPSAETYYNALKGKYQLVRLTQRYNNLQLPHINVIDAKDLRRRKIMKGMISPQLETAVREALANGEQAIIFQNRRGFSPVIMCNQCGWSPKCPNCDVSLTYHKTMGALTCHYCGYTYRMPTECPECKNPELHDRGAGTEKVEDAIAETFPTARISRMDLDTTHTRNAYERIISEFSSGKTNLLIGTQMVTKGLDFDNVSVVGILSADTMLNQPDFRAHEHAFMMMTQVAGRAGRKGRRGQVILQTANPQLPVIKQIVDNNYEGFFKSMMAERKYFKYPPFTRLTCIYLKHKNENTVNTAAIELGSRLRQVFSANVLGPDKPSVARVKLLHIRKIILKLDTSWNLQKTRECIRQSTNALLQDERYKSIVIYYDVDPS